MLGQRRGLSPTNSTVASATGEAPAKRLKRSKDEHWGHSTRKLHGKGQRASPATESTQGSSREVPDSDAESGSEAIDVSTVSINPHRTDLEQALPPVTSDKDAIEEYEASRVSGNSGGYSAELNNQLGHGEWSGGKSSIYVDAFNLALATVLEEESHLFDRSEMTVFEAWRNLTYEAQYLYVRLFLRKTAAWHRIEKLRYYGDIANMNAALDELFTTRDLPVAEATQISSGELFVPGETMLQASFTFADASDNHITSVEEASSLLVLDELKTLAKEAKFQGKNKNELLKALKRTSGTQTSLEFTGRKSSSTDGLCKSEISYDMNDTSLELGSSANSRSRFLQRIMSEVGQCVRLSEAPCKLFERVHLVFYRSTEWTEKSLTTIILARISRRNFPNYLVSRSSNVFASRSLLLEFEASLHTQWRVDNILEFHGTPDRESLQTVINIFEEIYPRWVALLEEEQQKEDSLYKSGEGAYLRRLSPAWVYTRIVHKGACVLGLGKFNEHAREHGILSKLLSQRLFHSSRRGNWYQRKALLEEHYLSAISPAEGRSHAAQKKYWKRIALHTCEQGLQDNLVHVIYHYDLQKRVAKLEKALKIPKRLQHDFGHSHLDKPIERTFEGVRIERSRPQTRLKDTSSKSSSDERRNPKINSNLQMMRHSTRTIWLDPSPDSPPGSEVSVEAMCLSHYRSLGWKGYHSEGGILRTLFALLFYDILFTYVPNVFQTPYQTCPLDLHTDSFYPSRMSEINARLAEIANGLGETIIVEVWERECERKTCVVGLDWGFELADLRRIVHCFGGEKLATVCKTIAQEYAQRGGGVPDLFLWRQGDGTEAGEVLFAEVKSANDRLSDTQRLWIHVLTNAGIRVELCNAVGKEVKVL